MTPGTPYLINVFSDVTVLVLYALSLFQLRYRRIHLLGGVLLYAVISVPLVQFHLNVLYSLLSLVLSCLFLLILFNIKPRRALSHAVMITALSVFCEVAVNHLIPRAFFDGNSPISITANTIVTSMINRTVYITVLYLISFILRQKRRDYTPQDRTALFIPVIPITSVIIMLLFISLIQVNSLTAEADDHILWSSILLLFIDFVLFTIYGYNRRSGVIDTQSKLLSQKEQSLSSYYKELHAELDRHRVLLHDFKKHIHAIILLGQKENSQQVTTYATNRLEQSDMYETARISDDDYMNSILLLYREKCKKDNIRLITDLRSDVASFLSDDEITSLFGNLLDNAIESCRRSSADSDHSIEIRMAANEGTPFVLLSVSNTCTVAPVFNEERIPFTTKMDSINHGVGLRSIQRVVSKYHGNIRMDYDSEKHIFHTLIYLRHMM